MSAKAAEESFRKGLACLQERGRQKEAMVFFEAACTLEMRASGCRTVQPRYRSYYGLCLGVVKRRYREGREVCQKAADQEFYNPLLWTNLGRLEMEWGRKEAARAALARAQRLAPGDREIADLLDLVGLRRPPVLSFLPRSHPLNRWLGKLRHAYFPPRDDETD